MDGFWYHGARQRHKRTHAEMATGRRERPSSTVASVSGSSVSPPAYQPGPRSHPLWNPPTDPSRTDMAGPSSSRVPQTVIDLTDDEPVIHAARATHPSAFSQSNPPASRPASRRDVIDVDALPERTDSSPAPNPRSSSPDVEFTFARQLPPRPHRAHDGRAIPLGSTIEPAGSGADNPRQRGRLSFDLEQLRSLDPARGTSSRRPSLRGNNNVAPSLGGRYGAIRHLFVPPVHHPNEQAIRDIWTRTQLDLRLQRHRSTVGAAGFRPPGALSYDAVALSEDVPQPRPAPTYATPKAAKAGYTRSPEEDDTIVCPSCDDELGVGATEEKRTVWFVKGCGHVYCGECTAHRTKASTKKGEVRKWKGEPFKYCLVCQEDGVQTVVTHREKMKQIFL